MVDIRNSAQLTAILEKIITEVIEEVSELVLKKVRDNIIEHTYNAHEPNEWYIAGTKKPTKQFLYAFEWDEIQKEANLITRTLFYNWQKMNSVPDLWIHGSHVPGWPEDAREFLAEWLNKSGPSSKLWISRDREPYWQITLQELFDSGQLKSWFDRAFRRRGIQ